MKQKNSILYKIQKCLILMISLLAIYTLNSGDIPLVKLIKITENIKPIKKFQASDAAVLSLALSPKEDFIVVGTGNSSGHKKFWGVSLWNKDEWNNKELAKERFEDNRLALDIHADYSTQQLAVSSNGKMIIGQSDDYIWKWDIENTELVPFGDKHFLPIDGPRIERTRFVPEKNLIIINQDISSFGLKGYTYTSAKIYDLDSGKLLRSLEGAHGHLADLVVNPEGTLVAGVINDGSAIVWKIATGKIVKELNIASGWIGRKAEKNQLITKMAISNNYIATYGKDEEIKLMDLNYNELKSWKIPNGVVELKITPNEHYIVFRNLYEGTMGIIDRETDMIVRFKVFSKNLVSKWPNKFIISKDSKQIIIGNDSGTIKIFDIAEIVENKPIKKVLFDLNMGKNSLMQLTASLTSLANK